MNWERQELCVTEYLSLLHQEWLGLNPSNTIESSSHMGSIFRQLDYHRWENGNQI